MDRQYFIALPFPPRHDPGVYRFGFVGTDKTYIGSGVSVAKRKQDHLYRFRKSIHHNQIAQKCWNKYGENAFWFQVIEYCNKSECISREQYYIDTLSPKMNMRLIAHSCIGMKRSDITKVKMSESQKGRVFSNETKEKMRDAKLGRKLSPEHVEKLRIASKGRTLRNRSEDEKTLNAKRQAMFSMSDVHFMKKLSLFWLSTKEISKCFDCAHTTIWKILNGKKRAYI